MNDQQETVPSQVVDKLFDSSVNMQNREKVLEVRRLLIQLTQAGVPESVCVENPASISRVVRQEPWAMCDIPGGDVISFIHSGKWASEGYRVLIEGGDERTRRRVMYYCLYRGIIVRLASFSSIARVYDWPTVLPIIGDFRNPRRLLTFEGMQTTKILAITEIDIAVPMSLGGADSMLTSILRGRLQSNRPTIITLTRPYGDKNNDRPRPGEIYSLVNTKHDIKENMVVRIGIEGDKSNEA